MLNVARDILKVSLCLFRDASLTQWLMNSSPYSIQAMVFHPGDVSCPEKLCFQDHCFDAGNVTHFKDLDISDKVTSMNV